MSLEREIPETDVEAAREIATNIMAYARVKPRTSEEQPLVLHQPKLGGMKIQHFQGRAYLAWGETLDGDDLETTHMIALGKSDANMIYRSLHLEGVLNNRIALGKHMLPREKSSSWLSWQTRQWPTREESNTLLSRYKFFLR